MTEAAVLQKPTEDLLVASNNTLADLPAIKRVEWALENLPDTHVMTSSFGVQSAAMLHLLTQVKPDIPVVVADTSYLFTETYQFIEQLAERLKLNLIVCQAEKSAAWQEAIHGKLWEQGVEGINRYNQMNKVEPVRKALQSLNTGTWFAGLRRVQSDTRRDMPYVDFVNGMYKVYPLVNWSNKDLHYYLQEHNLPYHPLWDKGYVSVGDWHTTVPLQPGMEEQDTRFFGMKRECGLHEFGDGI